MWERSRSGRGGGLVSLEVAKPLFFPVNTPGVAGAPGHGSVCGVVTQTLLGPPDSPGLDPKCHLYLFIVHLIPFIVQYF